MKRIALIIGLLASLSLAWTAGARGQDKVIYVDRKTGKDETANGVIQEESPAGITIKQATKPQPQLIPALDVVEVDYKPGDNVKGFQYKVPFGKEKEASKKKDVAERIKGLQEAQVEFDNLAKLMAGNQFAFRYLQYRSALVVVQIARLDRNKRDAAIDALNAFRKQHSTGWETVPALKTLARLQEEKGDIPGARETYMALRSTPGISKELELESTLLVSDLLLRAKKYEDAEKTLSDAKALMREDDPQRPLIVVHLCEAQLKQHKTQDIEKELQTAINNTADLNIRAVAHNTLGDYYREKKQDEEAFWQYLRVEVLYPQDREEHARALYWLSKLFESVKKDKSKASECLDKLKSKDYEGTEYAGKLTEK
jgi:tetratricopeptide (TPR) repeat protein